MNWKAYEEINFGNDIIYRWVREGEEYVSRMTLEQMDEFESKIRQQQAEIEALKKQCADIHENGAQVIDKCDKKIEELIKELNVLRESYDKLWDTASQQQAEIEAFKVTKFHLEADIDRLEDQVNDLLIAKDMKK